MKADKWECLWNCCMTHPDGNCLFPLQLSNAIHRMHAPWAVTPMVMPRLVHALAVALVIPGRLLGHTLREPAAQASTDPRSATQDHLIPSNHEDVGLHQPADVIRQPGPALDEGRLRKRQSPGQSFPAGSSRGTASSSSSMTALSGHSHPQDLGDQERHEAARQNLGKLASIHLDPMMEELRQGMPTKGEQRELEATQRLLREYRRGGMSTVYSRSTWDRRFEGNRYATTHSNDPEWRGDVEQHDHFEATEMARQRRIDYVGRLQDSARRMAGTAPSPRSPSGIRRTASTGSIPGLRLGRARLADVKREGQIALSLQQLHTDRRRIAMTKEMIRDSPHIDKKHYNGQLPEKRPPIHKGQERMEAFRSGQNPGIRNSELDPHVEHGLKRDTVEHQQEQEQLRRVLKHQPPQRPASPERDPDSTEHQPTVLKALKDAEKGGDSRQANRFAQRLTDNRDKRWERMATHKYLHTPVDRIDFERKGTRRIFRSQGRDPDSFYEGAKTRRLRQETLEAETRRPQQNGLAGSMTEALRRTASMPDPRQASQLAHTAPTIQDLKLNWERAQAD